LVPVCGDLSAGRANGCAMKVVVRMMPMPFSPAISAAFESLTESSCRPEPHDASSH
jgi:hypothetical protein